MVGRPSASAPCSKVCARGLGGSFGLVAAVQQRRRLGRQHLLGLVDLGALQRRELGDLVQRQVGEQLQEALDVGVLGVAPELPVVVGRQLSSLSQTAPAAVLPILAPDAVVSSGQVSA